MVAQPDTSVDGASRENIPPETPDRGPQDDTHFQALIDAAAAEDEAEDTDVDIAPPSEESPPTGETPPAPTPVVPNETENLRQQVAAYEQQLRQQAIESQRAQLEQETQQAAASLQYMGLDAEQASQVANQQRQFRERELSATQQLHAQQAYMQGKMNAALHYSQAHNVSAQSLMQYESPQQMEMAALGQAKMTALEAQVAQLKRGTVPAQNFDTNQPYPVAGKNENQLVDSALAKHSSERTDAEVKALNRVAGR